MKIKDRLKEPVPPFFRKVRLAGLALAAAGGTITASPVVLPEVVVNFGGYLMVAGAVLIAVSQATVTTERPKNQE